MEPMYGVFAVLVVAIVAAAVVFAMRRKAAGDVEKRQELADEIAQFNATRASAPGASAAGSAPPEAAPVASKTDIPSDAEAGFRKPGVPQREVDPLNDRSRSLQDRFDGSGRKR